MQRGGSATPRSCDFRAARSLIPAAATAAASVFRAIRFSRNRRTRASVTNPSPTRKRAVSHASRGASRDGPITSSTTGKAIVVEQ